MVNRYYHGVRLMLVHCHPAHDGSHFGMLPRSFIRKVLRYPRFIGPFVSGMELGQIVACASYACHSRLRLGDVLFIMLPFFVRFDLCTSYTVEADPWPLLM